MNDELAGGMRDYWDARAKENAAWYVDTSCDYDEPDMERFFAVGREIVATALTGAPVRPARRDVAVEIGCGLGRICLALREHFDRVVGVDISEEMVRKARELVDDSNVEFLVGDGTTLRPLGDGSADFVTSFTVLQHLPRHELIGAYLGEAARILRPGGVLAVQWNNDAHPLRYRLRISWWWLQHRFHLAHRHDPRLAPQFLGTPAPIDFVRQTLEDAGLVIRGTRGEGTLFAWIWAERP